MSPERYRKIISILNQRQPDLTVVMDDVNKPHNLSAIARSCDAVGIGVAHAVSSIDKIRLTQKAASGSNKWVEIQTHDSLEQAFGPLKATGHQIIAAHFSAQAVDYRDIDYTRPTAIVVGAELIGVSEKALRQADQSVIIPMNGMVQSLNVSVAAALILFEARRQRESAGLYTTRRISTALFNRLLFEWCHPDVAAYCRRRQLPYPRLNTDGEICEPLADRQPGSS